MYSQLQAQTVFWQDNFENATTPDIAAGSIRIPENNSGTGGPPNTGYFKRTNGSDISMISSPYSGFTNTFFWAGEDHDTPFGAGNEEQQIEWTGINISGKTNLTFRGFFGANSTNASWDNLNTGSGAPGFGIFTSPGNDYIIVQYAIDAGAYTTLLAFFGDDLVGGPGVAKKLKLDTNGDFIGDGTTLNQAMTEITKAIPGTGTVMKLRIRVFSNGTSEEWGIDNFRLTSGAILPVSLHSFTGKNTSSGVQLNWKSTNELNFDRYDVERSGDGNNFSTAGTVNANGSSDYSFTDRTRLATDKLYYRLKMIDADGRFSYSAVILIRTTDKQPLLIYPNPVKDFLHLNFGSHAAIENKITVYDAVGKMVWQSTVTGWQATIPVNQFSKGRYWIRINTDQLQSFIKE